MANRLAREPSLYLRQHAANPVFWQPWDDIALQQATTENKLIIVSIGYAACHWCHLMEHESFMDLEVAELMNAHFVAIKVDRESRPDLDALYMDALQLMSGKGGWPLNVVCLPDGRPVYGGTYFPRDQWLSALAQLHKLWQQNPAKVHAYANRLGEALQELAPSPQIAVVTAEMLQAGMLHWQSNYDAEAGGMLPAPKFPLPAWWRFQLYYSQFFGDEQAAIQLHFSLQKMAAGGMYDQLSGGFCRYSVDAEWRIPHFEKMLNDNAQLLSLYAEAYRHQPNPRYRTVVYACISWLEQTLLLNNGLYAASLDADSEGEEGKYYLWTEHALRAVLNDSEYALAEAYFDLQGSARWEGPLLVLQCTEKGADSREIKALKEKLLQFRAQREAPLRDEKALLAWNALLLEGLLEAYATFGEQQWYQQAVTLASKLLAFRQQGKWYRVNFNGALSQLAFSEDLVFTAWSFFRLYQLSGQSSWLDECLEIVAEIDRFYTDEASGFLQFSLKQEPEWNKRLADVGDHVQPAPASVYARLCEVLGRIYPEEGYGQRAHDLLEKMAGKFGEHLRFYPNWAYLGLQFLGDRALVHISGNTATTAVQTLAATYLPGELIVWSEDEKRGFLANLPDGEKLQIQRCVATYCELPLDSLAAYFKRLAQ